MNLIYFPHMCIVLAQIISKKYGEETLHLVKIPFYQQMQLLLNI